MGYPETIISFIALFVWGASAFKYKHVATFTFIAIGIFLMGVFIYEHGVNGIYGGSLCMFGCWFFASFGLIE